MADPDEIWAQVQAANAGSSSSSKKDNPPVYMGTQAAHRVPLNRMQPTPPGAGETRALINGPRTPLKRSYEFSPAKAKQSSIQAEINRLYEDDKYAAKVRKRLIAAGVITPEAAVDMSLLEEGWKRILTTAATYLQNGRKLTPWDVLELRTKGSTGQGVPKGMTPSGALLPGYEIGLDGNPVFAPYGLDPETGKPKSRFQTSTSTASSVEDISDTDAWAIMRGAAQQALGRDVSHEEIREFAYRANRLAAENPDEVTTTQTVDAATGDSSSHTTKKTGFGQDDAERMALEDLEDTPEAGAYQAATTYYNAMIGALDSPVSL